MGEPEEAEVAEGVLALAALAAPTVVAVLVAVVIVVGRESESLSTHAPNRTGAGVPGH